MTPNPHVPEGPATPVVVLPREAVRIARILGDGRGLFNIIRPLHPEPPIGRDIHAIAPRPSGQEPSHFLTWTLPTQANPRGRDMDPLLWFAPWPDGAVLHAIPFDTACTSCPFCPLHVACDGECARPGILAALTVQRTRIHRTSKISTCAWEDAGVSPLHRPLRPAWMWVIRCLPHGEITPASTAGRLANARPHSHQGPAQ